MVDSTFELFPADLLEAVMSHAAIEKTETKAAARATRTSQRHQVRRANAEAHLAEILPARIADGDSWHVISRGDIDSLSYLAHALTSVDHFDYVSISTWCMARADLTQLCDWLDAGKIDQLDFYVGEIFPNQYLDEFSQLLAMQRVYGCRVVVARNHSKVMCMANYDASYYLVAESSANVNTNPRIEQTALHANRDLYEFYREFFGELKTIHRGAHV